MTLVLLPENLWIENPLVSLASKRDKRQDYLLRSEVKTFTVSGRLAVALAGIELLDRGLYRGIRYGLREDDRNPTRTEGTREAYKETQTTQPTPPIHECHVSDSNPPAT